MAAQTQATQDDVHYEQENVAPNADWNYRGLRLKNYRSPMVQVALVGMIAFCTVGMSSALNGAGGGGLVNTDQSNKANTAVYSTFAGLAFFSGSIYNRLGVRVCLMFGGFGYALLESAYFATAHIQDRATPFIVIGGCVEGLSAAMFWTAQGAVTLSYPSEDDKGKAFSLFWILFQMGGVIGSIIPIAANWNSKAGTVSDSTFIAFIAIMVAGCFLPLLLLPSDKVVRKDGTKVIVPIMPTWKNEITALVKVFIADKWIATLFPLFIASNWFYTYQRNDFNAPMFTLRTRSFNGLWSNVGNMLGVLIMGYSLDFMPQKFSRQTRARAGFFWLLTISLAIWGGGWAVVKDTVRGVVPSPLIDLTDPAGYAGYLMLYLFWAIYDGMFQAYVYWLLGSLSNDSRKLSLYAGWYKSIQSAGSAIVASLDLNKISYFSMYLSTWMILVFSVLCAIYVVFFKVLQHSEEQPLAIVAEKVLDDDVEGQMGMDEEKRVGVQVDAK